MTRIAGSSGPSHSRFVPLACLALAAVVILLYGQTVSYGYIGLDDEHMIEQDHAFLKDLSNLPDAFSRDVFGMSGSESPYYRPLMTVSLMLDAQVGGMGLTAFRVTNVVLHLVGTCLVLCFLMALGTRREIALLLALVFAVHPLHVQSVAWIGGRNDSLLAVFALSALLLLIRFQRTGSWLAYGLHVLFFAFALFTKESALGLLVVQPLLIGLVLRQDLRSARSRLLGAAWLVVAVVWFTLRSAALPSGSASSVGLGGLVSNLPALLQYYGKIVLPYNLSAFPTLRDTGYASGVLAVGLTAAAFAASKNISWRKVGFGGAWFVTFLLPSLAVGSAPLFEHRMYLPLVGFLIAAGEADIVRRANARNPVFVVAALAVLATLFGLSFARCPAFRDFDSFWTRAVAQSPHSRMAHLIYGQALAERGRLDEAAEVFETYLERGGDDVRQIRYGLGVLRAGQGRLGEAERLLVAELEIAPNDVETRFELGRVYERSGRPDRAVELWEQITETHPRYARAYRALLAHYRSRGDDAKTREITEEMRRSGAGEPFPER